VTDFDLAVWLLTFAGLALGIWSIYWTRAQAQARRGVAGRWLFIVTLVELGTIAAAAAVAHSVALAPIALVSVFLVVAMLWDSPAAEWQRD
jgi:hypothetical protein